MFQQKNSLIALSFFSGGQWQGVEWQAFIIEREGRRGRQGRQGW